MLHASFLTNDLHLDAASAHKVSPATIAAPQGRLVTVVGGDESEEFHRQAALIGATWKSPTVTTHVVVQGCNHMTVLHELADKESPVFESALRLLGLNAG